MSIPDWAWALSLGTVVGMAGFWCKSVLRTLDRISESMSKTEKNLASVGQQVIALHGRVDRVEKFIDNFAERRK